jgi:lactoylglutathione lyase
MIVPKVRAVILMVADQDRALEFYTEKLGMEKKQDAEMWPGARWLEVAAPDAETYIALTAASDFGTQPGQGSGGFTMAVADVRRLYEELKARGVDVEEPKEERWSTYLRFTDPDGHQIMVSERVTGAEGD